MMRASLVSLAAAILSACCLSNGVVAQGCGPTRLKVNESVTLDLPPAKVWALVGNFQDMSWDPEAVATSGRGGNEPEKASRMVKLKGGATFGDSLFKYDAVEMSYSYHIDKIDVARLPVQNVSATLEVLPEAEGAKSKVRWKSVFYRYLSPGEGAPDEADANAAKAVKAFMRTGLDGLKAKAEAKT